MRIALALYTVRKADRPPDETHPYGHGKMENLSALVQGAFLFGVGGYIFYEAVRHLLNHAQPQRVDWYYSWTFAVFANRRL